MVWTRMRTQVGCCGILGAMTLPLSVDQNTSQKNIQNSGTNANQGSVNKKSASQNTDAQHNGDVRQTDLSLLPWSHRQRVGVKMLITVLSGIAVGIIGTAAHRMGAAQNIPYGLVLAFLIVGLSAWCARSRSGVIGIGLHLIASSGAVWMMAMRGPGGDAMLPVGFTIPLPFFSEYAAYIWLFGVTIVQMIMVALPSRWFVMPPREAVAMQKTDTPDDADDDVSHNNAGVTQDDATTSDAAPCGIAPADEETVR